MIDKLITEGEQLRNQTTQGVHGQFVSSEGLYKWMYKCVLFFEKNHAGSFVTEEIKNVDSPNGWNNNYIHEQIMGALMASKEMESE